MRKWDFDFKESIFYQSYMEEPGAAIRWFPVMEDAIYQDNDRVIQMCIRDRYA